MERDAVPERKRSHLMSGLKEELSPSENDIEEEDDDEDDVEVDFRLGNEEMMRLDGDGYKRMTRKDRKEKEEEEKESLEVVKDLDGEISWHGL